MTPLNGLPLEHLKVIDLTHARSGPTAVKQLADWGADVISVDEPPDSPEALEEELRNRRGSDRLNLHRNKRAITLNLKTDEGREVFFRMVREADVVVENFRPAVKGRLGIDYEAVRAVNPRIIYGSISGFGQDGPYADRPGVDQIAQGFGGLMSVTGMPGQGPVRVGIPIADLTSGIFLAQGILLALLDRERTGEGQWVQTSLVEALIAMLDFQATRWLIDGERPAQAGNDHPTGVPSSTYATSDGHINIGAAGRKFQRLADALGIPELGHNPAHATAQGRRENKPAINAAVAEALKKRSTAEWVEELNAAGVPCGPILHIDEALSDPQVKHLGIARPVIHPDLGRIEVVGQPFRLSARPQPAELRRAAPDPGQHTDEVLAELGYTEQQSPTSDPRVRSRE